MTDTALALVVLYVALLDGGTVLELYPAGDGPVTRTLLVLRVPGAELTPTQCPAWAHFGHISCRSR